jgi:hypothetical protein
LCPRGGISKKSEISSNGFSGDARQAAAGDGDFEYVIKSGPHLKQAREALGWSPVQLARALRLAGGDKQGEKRVLEMESGRRDISGPVTVAVESFLHGYLPVGFTPDGEMAAADKP